MKTEREKYEALISINKELIAKYETDKIEEINKILIKKDYLPKIDSVYSLPI